MTQDTDTVNVRYMVDDVQAAIRFYTTHLGFELLTNQSPAFADVKRGNLRLLLSGDRARLADPCPTVKSRARAGGTAFICSSTTSKRRSTGCGVTA